MIKHELIQDFQYVSDDKKIFILKKKTLLENYIYKIKDDKIIIDKDIVDSNPLFFKVIDWKTELISNLKANKIAQPTIVGKKIIPFIEELLSSNKSIINDLNKSDELIEIEYFLNQKESKLKEIENDLNIKLKEFEDKEFKFKENILSFDKKEELLAKRLQSLIDKEFEIENILKKESLLNNKETELLNLEDILHNKELDIMKKLEDLKIERDEINALNKEIEDWENLHWKFKRGGLKPKSCE